MVDVHTEDELQEFAEWERSSWEQRAVAYAGALGDLTRGSIAAVLDAAAVGHGMRVLDVGTGPGFVAVAAMERGATVQAADQSAAMVQIARSGGVDALEAGAESLPLDDGAFDAVVAGYLLNHLARPEAAVTEFGRVLAPGGRLAMTVWDTPDANAAIGLVGRVVTDLGMTGAVPVGPDSQRFSADGQLRTLLAAWDDVVITRPRWTVDLAPGAWFDAIADATPRTGAVLAQATPEQRAGARGRYIELATDLYGTSDGRIALPAAAVLVHATKP